MKRKICAGVVIIGFFALCGLTGGCEKGNIDIATYAISGVITLATIAAACGIGELFRDTDE